MKWHEVAQAFVSEKGKGRILNFYRESWPEGLIRNVHCETDQLELESNRTKDGRYILEQFLPYNPPYEDVIATDWLFWPVYDVDYLREFK